MSEVDRVLRRAARRLFVDRFLVSLTLAAAAALIAALALLLGDRLLGFAVDWPVVGSVLAVLATLGAGVHALATARDRARVARLIDERAELRESLSTALAVAHQQDPWSRATVEDARRRAASVDLRRTLPIGMPRRWSAPIVASAALLIAWLAVPQADLLGRSRDREAQTEQQAELIEAVAQVEEIDRDLEALFAGLGEQPSADPAPAADPAAAPSPDEIRRAAIRRLTAAQDRLAELRRSDSARALDAVRESMRDLRQPGVGPANDLVSALQRGDFSRASEALSEMMNKLAQGGLSEEQQQRLREQMKNLAEQMQKIAEQRKSLEESLRKAGVDPNLAHNPGALAQALENAAGLTEEQKQELRQQAQGAAAAAQQMQKLADAMQQAGQPAGDALQGMFEMADGLSDLEMLQQQMNQVAAGERFAWGKINDLSQCLGGGPGDHSPFQLWRDNMSIGRGNTGGADLDASDAQANTTKVKAPSPVRPGPIVGRMMVDGEQIRGESRAEFTALAEAGAQAAADAIETKVAPREYHEALKHYFGRLKEKAASDANPAPGPQR